MVYTALPQTDSSDCMNCQNFCNNNRCYPKANGSLSRPHALAQCHPDALELLPLTVGTTGRHGNTGVQPRASGRQETPEEGDSTSAPSQNSSSAPGEAEDGRGSEESVQCVESNGPVVCWERLRLPDSDCKEKIVWISTASLTGDFIQPTAQEI
ncbi:cell adhesion molecule-related/down-regulated by oncogenes-like [Brachyhypopomus gauderio]